MKTGTEDVEKQLVVFIDAKKVILTFLVVA
jgi:hypothetical protein